MNARSKTVAIMLACALALIVWDVYVAVNPLPGDTISEILLDWSGGRFASFLSGLVVGILIGHVFWPQARKK